MRISDLPRAISAVKGHWNPVIRRSDAGDIWVGFTPSSDDPSSRQQLRSTINRQMGHGYVLEYVSISLPPPNPTARPLTQEEKALHATAAGALTAVLKLANRPVHARDLIGSEQYEDLQDRWDQSGDRVRWSEAYPVIEAWGIDGWPKARDVLGLEVAARRCEMQSRVLKPLENDDRAKLAHLELQPVNLPAEGIAAAHYVELSRLENQDRGIPIDRLAPEDRWLNEDYSAVEGITKEKRIRLAQRDRRLVTILKRIRELQCAICSYDPIARGANRAQARAILEAHHKTPVSAGKRLSRIEDFILLCPTCHREVHQGVVSVPTAHIETVQAAI